MQCHINLFGRSSLRSPKLCLKLLTVCLYLGQFTLEFQKRKTGIVTWLTVKILLQTDSFIVENTLDSGTLINIRTSLSEHDYCNGCFIHIHIHNWSLHHFSQDYWLFQTDIFKINNDDELVLNSVWQTKHLIISDNQSEVFKSQTSWIDSINLPGHWDIPKTCDEARTL